MRFVHIFLEIDTRSMILSTVQIKFGPPYVNVMFVSVDVDPCGRASKASCDGGAIGRLNERGQMTVIWANIPRSSRGFLDICCGDSTIDVLGKDGF